MADSTPDPREVEFWVESIYGVKSRKPMVKLTLGANKITVDVATARKIGADIISASHAAEADGFLVEFLQEKVQVPTEVAAGILADFRDWRIFNGSTDL